MRRISLSGSWNLNAIPAETGTDDAAKAAAVPHDLQMTLPGDIHSTLIDRKIIPDPYFRKNELDVQWIGRTDWSLERTVQVSRSFLSGRQFIELDGADTFVTVFINGTEAGRCDNFFRLWRFDVTDLLHEGTNTIRLLFESSERYAVQKAKSLPYEYPCSVYDVSSEARNLVRKPQCHAGWDWGICLMVSGIYESIGLVQTASGFVDYVKTELSHDGDVWTVHAETVYTALRDGAVTFTAAISPRNGDSSQEASGQATTTVRVTKGENIIQQDITVEKPELWWPAWSAPETEAAIAAGKAPELRENQLYDLTVSAAGASKTVSVAFRTLLVEAAEDEYGKSFVITVNGRRIFAKGANWIPNDALPSRQTPERYQYLLRSLVQAKGNILRVWGGGFYEKEPFYDLCDRLGILIWQDCMFACSTYPADKPFLESVRLEIRHQVRRLQHHGCIAVWCGNNEDQGALTWYEASRNNRDRYLIDYDRLNEGTIGDEIKKQDSSRIWWPSSPSAGPDDYSDNWHADGRGDMHYWSVWHEKKPFEAYYSIRPRFVSEFGYQSLPALSECRTFTEPGQYNITSPDMEFHQRSPGGNTIIFENFARYYRVPATFAHTLYLSQVQQALAIQTAVTYWRSLKPVCQGAIIWQLDDLWPVASWSSIDYSGKWKLLQYNMGHFFEPVAAFLYKKEDTAYCYLLNDTAEKVAATLTIATYDFDGTRIRDDIHMDLTLDPDSSLKAAEMPMFVLPSDTDSYFMHAVLEYGTDGKQRSESTMFLTQPKKCGLRKAGMTADITETDAGFSIVLKADKPAFYVALDADSLEGHFSDNFFTLLPGQEKTVTFTPCAYGSKKARKPALSTFRRLFSVTALNDLW